EGNQNVEARKIGIYQGQVWHTDMAIKAEFDVARLHELNRPNMEPIWLTKNETASRVRGRIETVLDYAKAKEYLEGDNPAAWKG
ncbi:hypothetical protein MJL30_39420, partial [Salmonella enterica subsp. enterica serovar Anatum]|nr:hypothetical protein [Salmonella enterica subsp. enterica serovar Anatum]